MQKKSVGYRCAKRCFDMIFSVLFLIIFSPVYLLTAVIIKLSDPGPVLYKAKRVGKDGKAFVCCKFRSMKTDSGAVRLTTLTNDERIFPFGSFIRKTKIDEFPQIFHVLTGQMSVVGPRPEDIDNAEKIFSGDFREILAVLPGLTSPGSLYDYTHGEVAEDLDTYEREILRNKLLLELYYVRNCRIRYDLYLIFMTARVILQKLCGKKDFPLPKELQKMKIPQK